MYCEGGLCQDLLRSLQLASQKYPPVRWKTGAVVHQLLLYLLPSCPQSPSLDEGCPQSFLWVYLSSLRSRALDEDLSESHVRGSARKQEGRKLSLGGKEDSEGESTTEVPLRAPGAQSCRGILGASAESCLEFSLQRTGC